MDDIHEPGPIRVAHSDELQRVAMLLAEAFAHDAFLRWVCGGDHPERRRHFLSIAVERIAAPHGVVLVDEELDSAALLVKPGGLPLGPADNLRSLPTLLRATGPARLPRVLRGLLRLERAQPSEPHWTGLTLGVAPDRQGEGLGSRIIAAALEHIDASSMPAYLETSEQANVRLYERFGFRPCGEVDLPDGPAITLMWRSPLDGTGPGTGAWSPG